MRERAIVVQERALLPVRALSQALGSRVDYLSSLREIDVHQTSGPTIRLRIGSRTAWIGQKRSALDVAPIVVGGRTYAPLRFVADAMNVRVHYSSAQHAVLIPANAKTHVALAPGISGLLPRPYSANATAFPVIGANINDPKIAASAIRLLLDGTDVTMLAKRTKQGVLYLPSTPLAMGTHVAEISLDNGATIAERWAFTTTVTGAVATPEPAQSPLPSGQSFPEIQFYSLNGSTFSSGDAADVEMVAPPGGYAYAQACYSGWSYPLYANPGTPQIYDGWVQLPYYGDTQYCPIQGYYVDARGVQYQAPFSIFVSIYANDYYGWYHHRHHHHHRHNRGAQSTPTPSPSPSPSPTSAPPIGQRTPSPGNCPPGQRCILGGTPAPVPPRFDGGVKRPTSHTPVRVTHPVVAHPIVTHPVVTHPHFDGGAKRPTPHTPVRVTHPIVTHPVVTHPVVTHPVVTHPVVTHPIVTHPHFGGGAKRPTPRAPVHISRPVHASHPVHASSSSHTTHHTTHHATHHTTHHVTHHATPHPKATSAP